MSENAGKYFQGCQDSEIIELENEFEITLPWIYKTFFLRLMGHSAGEFLQGEDCFYRHLSDLQEWARELLAENDFPKSLPDDAFVFFMHQGYQFSFFRLSEGDDPPVYFYCEGQDQESFVKSHDSFSDFLITEMQLFKKYANPDQMIEIG